MSISETVIALIFIDPGGPINVDFFHLHRTFVDLIDISIFIGNANIISIDSGSELDGISAVISFSSRTSTTAQVSPI